MIPGSPQRPSVVVGYCSKDREWLERFQVHLQPLEADVVIDRWDETRIRAASQWREQLRESLSTASAAVLFITADFVASELLVEGTLLSALQAEAPGGLEIFPLVLKPCRLKHIPYLTQLRTVNAPGRTLVEMDASESESLWVKLVDAIEAATEKEVTRPAAEALGTSSTLSTPYVDQPAIPVTAPGRAAVSGKSPLPGGSAGAPGSPRLSPTAPSGIVTLVFTDIQDSSVFWENHREAFKPVLNEHNQIIRQAASHWDGLEVKTEGDAFFLAFSKASSAVQFAIDVQRSLAGCEWSAILPQLNELKVRIGMHTGEALAQVGHDARPDYFGPTVNRAARIGAAAHGQQIIVSDATRALALAELSDQITFRDRGMHQLKGVGTEKLWQVHHPDLRTEFPALKTLDIEHHNIPTYPTSFVGRQKELLEWCNFFQIPAIRLITLVGFGGVGKSRLAAKMAEMLAADFEDGVWWIELEQASNQDEMVERIAYGLRMHLQPQPSGLQQLLPYLRSRNLLLVLDNTEQISDMHAGHVIGMLMKESRGVKCLVTSRCPLEIQAEQVVELLPLPLADSIRLFEERARSRKATFSITPENSSVMADLCTQLEGLPLAVELAASRINVLTPREILTRISKSPDLLSSRDSGMKKSHRTLRTTIDWSYNLLTESNQRLLERISVFRGGFTLEQAEAIANPLSTEVEPSPAYRSQDLDLWEGIADLCRHSLLRSQTDATSHQSRYIILEVIRQYAAERLAGAPDECHSVHNRHGNYFLEFVECAADLLGTPDEAVELDRMRAEIDNLRAAMTWLCEAGEGCSRFSLAFGQFMAHQGLWAEARRCLEAGLLAAATRNGEECIQAAICRHLASINHDMGRLTEAYKQAHTGWEISEQQGNCHGAAEALNLLGVVAMDQGEYQLAQQHFIGSLGSRETADHNGLAKVLNNLARLSVITGDGGQAEELYKKALVECRAAGDIRREALILGNLGVRAQDSHNLGAAKDLWLESLALRRRLQDRHGIAVLLHNLGELAVEIGDFERAAGLFVHAKQIFDDLGASQSEITADHLVLLEHQVGADHFSQLSGTVRETRWEELVDSLG